jgi:hypothetical protein
MTEPIRIANCSGFFGDRPSGALEMVEGGPIDVLTGDWLAELTMLILSRIRAKHAKGGFARTFVAQMEQVMGTCLDRGIKVVSNAGGLDPDGCADAVQEVADRLGLSPTIAYIDGDDLMPRIGELVGTGALQPFGSATDLGDPGRFLTANAYLGCFGIVDALAKGADIVITGRVTDAAVTCGPAAWHHGWSPTDYDQLAGGVVAGHIIECSAQVTGGNYSFFHEIEGREDVGGGARFGFPWAEVAADGSCVIGKHDGTGGVVNVETVTSQLLYEIGGPEYLGPDVTARFDTIEVEQVGRDRVRVSGTRGQAPPETLKVAMNELGGYRNSFTVALTGLDIDAKAAFAQAAFWDACPYGPDDFAVIESRVVHTEKADPATQEEATAMWRVTVKDPDERKVGRAFADAMVHTVLAGIPGMYGLGGGPSAASPFGVYRPATDPRATWCPSTSTSTAPPPRSSRLEQAGSVDDAHASRGTNGRTGWTGGETWERGAIGRGAARERSSAPGRATRAATRIWACTHAATRDGRGSTPSSPSTLPARCSCRKPPTLSDRPLPIREPPQPQLRDPWAAPGRRGCQRLARMPRPKRWASGCERGS